MSAGRRWAVWLLALLAIASTTWVVSSATPPVKESAGADLSSAHAAAIASARLLSAKHESAHRKHPDTSPLARDRTADNSHAAALFASHSWYVAPPPPPPAPPPPPLAPTAPPFPYTFVGAYTSQGDGTVYFLAQGDRVVDAHVGDRLDGVYQFESATAGQLTFNYLPLNIRQLLSTGAPQ